MNTDRGAVSLATAVADRDAARLGFHFTDDVRLRALLPGGPIEAHGREAVLAAFAGWFGDYASVELDEADGEFVGDRLLVHYRLVFNRASDAVVLSQTWVSSVNDHGEIFRVDLVCSGFRPLHPPTQRRLVERAI